MAIQLLANQSATGAAMAWGGGPGVFLAAGTFGGATVSFQYLGPDSVSWLDAGTDTTLTASGGGQFTLPPVRIRAAITGGSPSGIYAMVERAGA